MTTAEKLQKIAENVPKVYNKGYYEGDKIGYENGHSEGYNLGKEEGYHEGKQAEYDAFWDLFQDYGNRITWRNGCSGQGWTDETFKPKYPFAPDDAYMMFAQSRITHLPIEVNFSGAFTMQYCFWFANKLEELPTIVRNGGTMYGAFNNCTSLHTIEKIVFAQPMTEANALESTFDRCLALVNITFEGNNINMAISFRDCTLLSHDSIVSVINNLSTNVSGKTATFSKTAVSNAFEGGSTGSEWQALIATKPNWTISLV